MSPLTLRLDQGLQELPAAARDLWIREEPALQFDQTLAWSELLAAHALEAGEQVQIVSAHRGATCVGVLPLKRVPPEGPWKLRAVRALANYYCSLYAPILDSSLPAGERAQVLRALLETAATLQPDALDLNPIAEDAQGAGAVMSAFESLGWRTEKYFRFGNWYLEVGGRDFAQYFGGLPSQLRNTVTRKEKKLRALAGISIAIAQTPAEAEVALEGYQRIYAASWKKPEPHPDFVPSLVRQLASRGWLRMGLVKLGDEPVASQIWACKDGVVSIFKLAYDEKHQQLSAGSVLTTQLMRHVIDADKARIVDYLTGDDSYKRDWMSHRRERVGVRALRPGSWRAFAERATAAAAVAARPAKRAVESLRQRLSFRRRPPTAPNA